MRELTPQRSSCIKRTFRSGVGLALFGRLSITVHAINISLTDMKLSHWRLCMYTVLAMHFCGHWSCLRVTFEARQW